MDNTPLKWMSWGHPYFRTPPYVLEKRSKNHRFRLGFNWKCRWGMIWFLGRLTKDEMARAWQCEWSKWLGPFLWARGPYWLWFMCRTNLKHHQAVSSGTSFWPILKWKRVKMCQTLYFHLEVSGNGATHRSSILIGFPLINQLWGYPYDELDTSMCSGDDHPGIP